MTKRSSFVANRHWIVGEIGELIEAGTKSDEHSFGEKFLELAEEVILILLKNEKGKEFKLDSDAVIVAINSPRGSCIEALINLSLRSCRLADKQCGNHAAIWAHFQPIYDAELAQEQKLMNMSLLPSWSITYLTFFTCQRHGCYQISTTFLTKETIRNGCAQ